MGRRKLVRRSIGFRGELLCYLFDVKMCISSRKFVLFISLYFSELGPMFVLQLCRKKLAFLSLGEFEQNKFKTWSERIPMAIYSNRIGD